MPTTPPARRRARFTRPAAVAGVVVMAVAFLAVGFGATRADASPAPPSLRSTVLAATSPTTVPATASSTPGIGVGPVLPTTTTTTVPGGNGVAVSGAGGCGLFNVTCHVTSAINAWFKSLVTSALNPILGLLGRSVLATPDVTGGKVGELWAITAGIANALVVLLVLAGGAVVMSHETGS